MSTNFLVYESIHARKKIFESIEIFILKRFFWKNLTKFFFSKNYIKNFFF